MFTNTLLIISPQRLDVRLTYIRLSSFDAAQRVRSLGIAFDLAYQAYPTESSTGFSFISRFAHIIALISA